MPSRKYVEVVRVFIYEDANRRSYCHSEVVAQSVIAYAFGAAARRQYVDCDSTVGYCECTEGTSVQRSHQCEEHKRACGEVSAEEKEEQKEAHHEHFLARKAVDNVSAERPEQQRRDRVA